MVKSRDELVIYIKRRGYKASRLMWLHVHGVWPEGNVFFKDNDKMNYKIANLEAMEYIEKDIPLTVERLRYMIRYDKDTGYFYWNVAASDSIKVGDKAGFTDGKGYWGIRIDKQAYRAHRIAWLYSYGEWPVNEIDHIDGDPSNNKISNLREATHAENLQNQRKPQKSNTTGYLGVCFCKKTFRYSAKLKDGSKYKSGPYRATAEEAANDYLEFKRLYHPFGTI